MIAFEYSNTFSFKKNSLVLVHQLFTERTEVPQPLIELKSLKV